MREVAQDVGADDAQPGRADERADGGHEGGIGQLSGGGPAAKS